MLALKVFIGKHDFTPLVLKTRTRKAVIDLGEVWIKKYGITTDVEEIEEELECYVSFVGDYIVIRPKAAVEYAKKEYGEPVINNFDKELLLILGDWFKKHASKIKKLIQTGSL